VRSLPVVVKCIGVVSDVCYIELFYDRMCIAMLAYDLRGYDNSPLSVESIPFFGGTHKCKVIK
jgi:hypothetical protein